MSHSGGEGHPSHKISLTRVFVYFVRIKMNPNGQGEKASRLMREKRDVVSVREPESKGGRNGKKGIEQLCLPRQ